MRMIFPMTISIFVVSPGISTNASTSATHRASTGIMLTKSLAGAIPSRKPPAKSPTGSVISPATKPRISPGTSFHCTKARNTGSW